MNVTIVERFFAKYQNVHEIFHQPSKLSKQLGTCPARTCHEYRIKPLNGPLTITGFKGKNSTLTSQSFGHLTRLRYETRSFEREKERVDVSACPFEGCRLENVADGCQLTLAPGQLLAREKKGGRGDNGLSHGHQPSYQLYIRTRYKLY